jgi:hypothetical protein
VLWEDFMLSPEEIFPLYAELSLALAGFTGVVSAFAGRDRRFRPTERVRFLAVVSASACVLAGCFTVFATSAGGYDLAVSLRLSGAVCLVISLASGLPLFVTSWRAAGDPDSTTEMWSLYVSLVTFILLWTLYASSVVTEKAFVALVTGFSIHLLHGLWMFVRVLTRAN